MATAAEGMPFGSRIHQVAESDPDGVAILFAAADGSDREVTWRELDERSTQLAHVFARHGLGLGDFLAIGLRNQPEHLMVAFGAWKVGATVVPVRWDLPAWEQERVLAAVRPKLVVAENGPDYLAESLDAPTTRLPEVVSPRAFGICSGGSTGIPKVIVVDQPGVFFSAAAKNFLVESYAPLPQPQRVLIPAPLYHTNGFAAINNLLNAEPIVLLERFDPVHILDLVERLRITGFIAATTMLQRLQRVEGIESRDLSSLDWVQQGASPLPTWLGRRWCELVGPERFFVSYGATERHGVVVARGDQWLAHPGTVGLPFGDTEVAVLDPDGNPLPPGEVGGIYMRATAIPPTTYRGDGVTQLTRTEDGFLSVGDLGWVDDDGFLYIADRRVDMIVTGGSNVYPAEVEAAVSEHPEVADVVVVGLSDPEWGRRVHAIIQPTDAAAPPDVSELLAWTKSRLSSYKVPKTVEFVDRMPRSEAMKVNRQALVAERDGVDTGVVAGPTA